MKFTILKLNEIIKKGDRYSHGKIVDKNKIEFHDLSSFSDNSEWFGKSVEAINKTHPQLTICRPVPARYRNLNPNDKVNAGDEYFYTPREEWMPLPLGGGWWEGKTANEIYEQNKSVITPILRRPYYKKKLG